MLALVFDVLGICDDYCLICYIYIGALLLFHLMTMTGSGNGSSFRRGVRRTHTVHADG